MQYVGKVEWKMCMRRHICLNNFKYLHKSWTYDHGMHCSIATNSIKNVASSNKMHTVLVRTKRNNIFYPMLSYVCM